MSDQRDQSTQPVSQPVFVVPAFCFFRDPVHELQRQLALPTAPAAMVWVTAEQAVASTATVRAPTFLARLGTGTSYEFRFLH